MTDTKFDICSRALVEIGASAIASFEDGTREANAAAQLYEGVVRAKLHIYPWRWATQHWELGASLADAPDDARWTRQHQLPAPTGFIRTVVNAGQVIEFDRYGDRLLSRLGTDDRPIMVHTVRLDESQWPAWFTAALELELAARFAGPITRNGDLVSAYFDQAMLAWAQARSADSHSHTTRSAFSRGSRNGRMAGFR